MATESVSVTLDVTNLAGARDLARRRGKSLSAWLDELAGRELRRAGAEAARDFLGTHDGKMIQTMMADTAASRGRALAEVDPV